MLFDILIEKLKYKSKILVEYNISFEAFSKLIIIDEYFSIYVLELFLIHNYRYFIPNEILSILNSQGLPHIWT